MTVHLCCSLLSCNYLYSTEAITLCPNVAVYWTNRALCYMKKNDWTKVEEDCIEALKRDRGSVKDDMILSILHISRIKRNKLHHFYDNISKSREILTAMSRRMSQNKWIIGSIIIALVVAVILILYFKLSH